MSAWPGSPGFGTTNVDAGTDSPAAARSNIKDLMDDVSDMIGARGANDGVAPLDGDGKVPIANLPSALGGVTPIEANIGSWGVPGTYLWSVPVGVTRIKIICAGAGGGGSNGYLGANPSTWKFGGGAGAVAIAVLDVTPGSTITINVGAGGAGGTGNNSSASNGGDGGDSSVVRGGNTILAGGGKGGNAVSGASGAGGVLGGNTLHYGRNGNPGFDLYGGTNELSGWSPAGSSYGGGGGCGVSGVIANGYVGLNGLVIISY
jgi:hypothetical protein